MTHEPAPAHAPSRSGGSTVPVSAVMFIAAFAVLLTSFPVRNFDLWGHLAAGRDALRTGTVGPKWLYELGVFGTYSAVGGAGLVAVKALLFGAAAVLLLRLASQRGWGLIPLGVTGLAVLATGTWLLVHPTTASVLLLVAAVWLVFRRPASGRWPDWRLLVLFVAWANVDGRFVIGLAVVALAWLGAVLDEPSPESRGPALRRWVQHVALLVLVSCLSVSHVRGFAVPPEIRAGFESLRGESESSAVHSPFDRDSFALVRENSATLAYYPLLVLGVASFALNRRGWRWAWFLPWAGLAAVSAAQVRAVPFFAVVAGPVTAWNLQAFFASRGDPAPEGRSRFVRRAATAVLATAFLVAAWPGWLQGPPFEPRRWAVDPQPALEGGAAFLRQARAAGGWAQNGRTLHESPTTLGAFAWFDPEDPGVRDDEALGRLLAGGPDDPRERLRALGVTRVVVYPASLGNPGRPFLDGFLANPQEWPVLHLGGGLVVFGWRDPARPTAADPFDGWEVDFRRLAFRPTESEVAPPPAPREARRWWDSFLKPAPPRPPGRDEAEVLLRKGDAAVRSAPLRHLQAWEAGQVAGLVGAGGGWTGLQAAADAEFRLALLRPPLPAAGGTRSTPPPITLLAFALQQRFALDRGSAPVGVVYAAIRAARRAVAENPADANAHLLLGQAYAALVSTTAEQAWAAELPQLLRARQVQAAAALARAVELNPHLAPARHDLGRLYQATGCLDLAVPQLRAYRAIPSRRGGPRPGTPETEAFDAELDRLAKALDQRTAEFAADAGSGSVADRAVTAARRELGGAARDLLLKSNVAAFGTPGMSLELDLLLRTGRPGDVLDWTPEEVRGSLGDLSYRWARAQAHLALGDYDAADADLGGRGPVADYLVPPPVVGAEVAGLVGKSLLDEQGGLPFLPNVLSRGLSRSDLRTRISEVSQNLGREAEIAVLRGVLALEAGNVPRARACFRLALSYSPERFGSGQLEFAGRRIAWEALTLIDDVPAR